MVLLFHNNNNNNNVTLPQLHQKLEFSISRSPISPKGDGRDRIKNVKGITLTSWTILFFVVPVVFFWHPASLGKKPFLEKKVPFFSTLCKIRKRATMMMMTTVCGAIVAPFGAVKKTWFPPFAKKWECIQCRFIMLVMVMTAFCCWGRCDNTASWCGVVQNRILLN
jgi:magnesium-transporting ATPase (P-type)